MSQAQRLQGLKGPAALYSSNIPKPAASSSKNSSSKSSTKKDNKNAVLTGLPYNTPLQRERLERCDWKDRLIYSSRMLLGGNNVNGFLRGTATAQRIKKQRARQVGITKKTAASQAAGTGPDGSALDKNKKPIFSQEEEEKLKKGTRVFAYFLCLSAIILIFTDPFRIRGHESKNCEEVESRDGGISSILCSNSQSFARDYHGC